MSNPIVPVIRAQKIIQRPKLTYAAVVVCAAALIVAVVLASVSFANQQQLNRNNQALSKQNSMLLAQTRAALARTQRLLASREARSDARWCSLFGLLLSNPVTTQPQTAAQKATTARFLVVLTQQNREFKCPRR